MAWDPSPDSAVVAYRLYWGGARGAYTNWLEVGNATVAVVPSLEPATRYFFAATALNLDDQESEFSNEVEYTTPPAESNRAPTISNISDRSVNEDVSTGTIAFTVADPDSPLASLVLSATSSNPTLVPVGNIVFGGSGGNRTVTVRPASNRSGTATLTVIVTDGTLRAQDSFVLTVRSVNDRPTLGDLTDRTINEDASTGAIPFSVGDVDNDVRVLALSATSSNPALVPPANVVFGGTGASRTVTVTPLANATGSSTITVTVSDGALSRSDGFVLVVNPVADPPEISPVADRTIPEDGSTGPIPFTVTDPDTPTASLMLVALSGNPVLVPDANIRFGGSGNQRTITVTPAAEQSGVAPIYILVWDATQFVIEDFLLTVTAVNDAPRLGPLSDLSLESGAASGAISFAVSDPDSEVAALRLQGASHDPALAPDSNLVFDGAGTNRTLTVRPLPGQWGSAAITVTVSDGAASASGQFNLTVVPSLPPPWAEVDIGAPDTNGGAGLTDGVYRVSGAGTGIGGTFDQFHFVYQRMSGDGAITARLVSLASAGGGTQAGLMLRSDLGGASRNYFLGLAPGQFLCQARLATGATTRLQPEGPANPNAAAWVRVIRSGNVFSAYRSSDGVGWTAVNSTRLPLPSAIYVGLAVSSQEAAELGAATVDHVSVIP